LEAIFGCVAANWDHYAAESVVGPCRSAAASASSVRGGAQGPHGVHPPRDAPSSSALKAFSSRRPAGSDRGIPTLRLQDGRLATATCWQRGAANLRLPIALEDNSSGAESPRMSPGRTSRRYDHTKGRCRVNGRYAGDRRMHRIAPSGHCLHRADGSGGTCLRLARADRTPLSSGRGRALLGAGIGGLIAHWD